MSSPQNQLMASFSGLRSQSDTALIRWCVVAIAAIAVWVWVVEPLQLWTSELRDQVDRNAAKATRMRGLEQNADLWLIARDEVRAAAMEAEQHLFAAASDTQAQAMMQGLLRQYALDRNLNVDSQKLMDSESAPPVGTQLAIEIGVRGNLSDVLRFLDDVSRSDKLFVFDRWVMQMERGGRTYARLTVMGYRPAPEGGGNA